MSLCARVFVNNIAIYTVKIAMRGEEVLKILTASSLEDIINYVSSWCNS